MCNITSDSERGQDAPNLAQIRQLQEAGSLRVHTPEGPAELIDLLSKLKSRNSHFSEVSLNLS